MATKRPLCIYSGTIEELKTTDSIVAVGLFEIDIDGGLMPITDTRSDNYYELDVDDNIQPLEA